MKTVKKNKKNWLAILLACCMTIGSWGMLGSISVSAADTESDTLTYEEKKAAYREYLENKDVTKDDFLIGCWTPMYNTAYDSYEYQLDQMADLGINFNIHPLGNWSLRDAAFWEYVETEYGKRNILYLMWGGWDQGIMNQSVQFAAGKEHCIGYYLSDEPNGDLVVPVANAARAYAEADPDRFPYVNLLPSYAGEERLGGTYEEHVQTFVDVAGYENGGYLSHDYYAFGTSDTSEEIYADVEVIRSVAYESGRLKTHAFPQSTAWAGRRMPNMDELRWNAYLYLAYGFKALSWFTLVCPGNSDTEGEGFYDAIIYRDGTIRDPELFNGFKELNWEIRGLSDALMNLDTVHAYHTQVETGTEQLAGYFMSPVDSGLDFVVSHMEAKDGSEPHVMLFNKSWEKGTEASFLLDTTYGIRAIEYLDPLTGEYVPMDISDGVLTDEFKAGEGKLYRIKMDTDMTRPYHPTVSLESGRYEGPQTVTLIPDHAEDVLYYTLDGSYPTAEDTRYTGPIVLGENGKSSLHTLRVVAVRNGNVGLADTYSYLIEGASAPFVQLATVPSSSVSATGRWSVSGQTVSLTGGADAEMLNGYLDTSVRYTNFRAEATFAFDDTADDATAVGFLLKAAEGDDYIFVGMNKRGTLTLNAGGERISLTRDKFDVSAPFAMQVMRIGTYLQIEVNGKPVAEVNSDQITASNGYLGVNGRQGCVASASDVVFRVMEGVAPVGESALVEMIRSSKKELAVTVARNAAAEEITVNLPDKIKGRNQEDKLSTFSIDWDLSTLDTAQPGVQIIHGSLVIPEGSGVVNPLSLRLAAWITVRNDPDREALNQALTVVEGLDATLYSEATYAAVQAAREAALAVTEGDIPQAEVDAAVTALTAALAELDPTGVDFTGLDAMIAALKATDLSRMTAETRAIAEAALAKGEGFARKGAITQADVDALANDLKQAKDGLVAQPAPEETTPVQPDDETTNVEEPDDDDEINTETESKTETSAPEEEKGCTSTLGLGLVAVLTSAAAAVALAKKKDEA